MIIAYLTRMGVSSDIQTLRSELKKRVLLNPLRSVWTVIRLYLLIVTMVWISDETPSRVIDIASESINIF